VADEIAHLKAELAYERRKARWVPYKGDPERQCTATTRGDRRCKAPRAKRKDGTLATTCRFHGGVELSPEARVKALQGLVRLCEARLKGAQTKLALALEELKGVRDMGATSNDHTHMVTYGHSASESSALYSGPIEDSQCNQALSGGPPESSQATGLEPPSPDVAEGRPTEG
jgi:hypothetical protein